MGVISHKPQPTSGDTTQQPRVLFDIIHEMPAMSDVLTPLSDCRQESVKKMDRRISGVSYMCEMDFHNGILCCGFLCARIISLYFSTPFLSLSYVYSVSLLRLPRQGLPRPIYIARNITPLPLYGYHTCVFTSRLPRHSSEFHFWVITPELSRSTTHVNSGYLITRLS